MIDGIGDGDSQPAAQDEMQGVGDVSLMEQDVATDQVLLVTRSGDVAQHIERGLGEEFGLRKKVFVSHARRTVLPSPVVPLAAAEIVWTVVVAGGSGSRTGSAKQYELVGSRRVIDHAADTARGVSDGVVLVVPAADVVAEGGVPGGATRSASVRAGLAAVPVEATIICVHDAARPFASAQLFTTVIDAIVNGADGAVPGLAVADTIKRIDADGCVVETPQRAALVAVQTPQAFRADVLRAAHAPGNDATDDSALVEAIGGRVMVVPGEPTNRKITDRDDLVWARNTAVRDGR
jgi:2-C-methyl-D-erythritol 4-phosphate cytidylyltransferase